MSVTECIREFCSGSASQDAPRALARDIANEKTDLLTIVEALREYLTSSAVEQRCQGTRLLSETLISLSSRQLPQDDVHYLVAFYCDRLKDKVAVLPYVLRGLHAMVVNQRVSSDDVIVISRAIYSHVYNQSLPQGERRLVYTILDYFLSDYTQAVKEMGSEFVLGYIQTMDGEKDPRNLVIALNSVTRIVLSLPFEVLAEDLFEVVACYFPIDFTPPPDDPHVVSKEQLVLALRNCLTSTPKFTEFCLPLMLEKVSSDLLSAKLDSLLTIAAGCHTFDPKVLHTHLQPLWTAIWKEILQPVSDEVEAAGAQCLESVSQSLGAGTGGERVGEFAELVLKDCSRHLMDLELKLLGPASRALRAVARGCGQACRTITAASVPLLLNQFHSRSAVTQKKAFLQVLAEFINILHRFHGANGITLIQLSVSCRADQNLLAMYIIILEPCPLDNLKTELISLVVSSVRGRTQSLVETGLDVCRGLLVLRGFLDDKEILMLVEHVKQVALCSSESLAVRERSCNVLGCVSQSYPHIAKEEIVPPLLQRFTPGLPMETDHMEVQSEIVSLPDMSRVLVSLSSSQELQELTLPVFVAVLEQLAQQSLTTELVETTEAEVGHLSQLVEKTVSGGSSVGTRFVHKVVAERMLVLCVLPSLPESSAGRMFTEKAVLQQCRSLLRTFTLAANNTTDVNESWARLIREVFTDGSSSLLPHGLSFLPLKPSSPPVQTRLTSILLYTLGAMKKETVSSQVTVYLPRLLEQAMLCPDEQSSTNCAVCYASVISKINNKEAVEEFVGPAMSSLWQVITDESGSGPEARTRSLTAWLWVCHAKQVPNLLGSLYWCVYFS
jgi:DNA repair/transcription protein MET18/MMS19